MKNTILLILFFCLFSWSLLLFLKKKFLFQDSKQVTVIEVKVRSYENAIRGRRCEINYVYKYKGQKYYGVSYLNELCEYINFDRKWFAKVSKLDPSQSYFIDNKRN